MNSTHDNKQVLIRSHFDWWVNPLMVLSICIIFFFIIALLPDNHYFSIFLHYFAETPRVGGRILFGLLSLPIAVIITLWNLPRVSVFSDRVEIKYFIGLYNSSTIMMNDVDGYCINKYYIENKYGKTWYRRVLLIKGNKLYMYVTDKECSNYDEMVSVLTDFFCLEMWPGEVSLGVIETERLKNGKYVVRNELTEDILADIRKRRDERLQHFSDSKGWDVSSVWTFEVTGWKNFLLIAIIAALFIPGVSFISYTKILTLIDSPF